ncbi:MAG: L,D-transpeptidase family protein [Pseudomonadota bacterium]
MPHKSKSKQTQTARRFGLVAMLSSLLVLPLFGLLMPSNAAEAPAKDRTAAATAPKTETPQLPFEDTLFADPDRLKSRPDTAEAVSLSDTPDGADATPEISRDNGLVTDNSPSAAVSRPASNAVAMVGDYPIRKMLTVEGPFEHGDWVWDEANAPKQGKLLITVNLEDQVMSVYRGGYEIGTAVILYGADEKPTPTGKFTITEKDIDHVSNLYFAPMPYMLRLTNDGIAIHGSEVEFGYATHGCVGIPDEFAAQLFAIAKLGDQVVISA